MYIDFLLWNYLYPDGAIGSATDCDSQSQGSSPGWAPLHSGLGQATYTCVPVTKQYNLIPAKGVISLAGKVTVGLVESNGSLPPGLWLMSPAGWLPRNRDQLHAQCSLTERGTTYFTVLVNLNSVVPCIAESECWLRRWSTTVDQNPNCRDSVFDSTLLPYCT